jgi:hypothetical protein
MALSNWASIIFDNEGKSTQDNGAFGRLSVEPYKCWLYIHSPEIWKEGEAFTGNVIAQINEGDVNLMGVQITVESVDLVNKDGIPYGIVRLFYCQKGYGDEAKYYGGIICSAYLNVEAKIAKDMGIPDHCEIGGGSNSGPDGKWTKILWAYDPTDVFNEGKMFEVPLPEQYQDMLDAFYKWKVPDEAWLAKVKQNDNPQWANQGDAFFAGPEAQQTIGQTSTPMIMGMIKQIFADEEPKKDTDDTSGQNQ